MTPYSPARIALATALLLAAAQVNAQAFSAQVMPPRFEAAAKPGETYRNVIEIRHESTVPARYIMRTADWSLDAAESPVFEYALQPGSCRPWVGIEAPELRMSPNSSRRYRFEVAVPADAPAGQCRFAIMIEGEPQMSGSGVPIAGRIAVVVYLNVGGAAANLAVTGSQSLKEEGATLPALRVANRGNAHGRLEGMVDGTDADGKRWTLAPANSPILPGATRVIALRPVTDAAQTAAPVIRFPIVIKGSLDWGSQRIAVDATIAQ